MCHESCVQEWTEITRKAYQVVWVKFFKSFRMDCPQQVILNLELTSDFVDRKVVNTDLCTASGAPFLKNIPQGIILK